MKAGELFDLIHQYSKKPLTTLCRLHFAEPRIPCPQSKYFCGMESVKDVVDFDDVKNKYCREESIHPIWKSVDAVLSKEDIFLFVEIKSWRNFDFFQLDDADSEDVRNNKVTAQAKGFKLKEKIDRSMMICQGLAKDKKLFELIPTMYVLVTDVETVLNPLVRLRAQLGVLAYKAVNIPLYTNASMAELNALGMNVRYKNCREFDAFIDSL